MCIHTHVCACILFAKNHSFRVIGEKLIKVLKLMIFLVKKRGSGQTWQKTTTTMKPAAYYIFCRPNDDLTGLSVNLS